MPNPHALQSLHDIRLPEAISWWPLAWGWYFLALLAIFFIVLSSYLGVRHYRHGRARREALQLLAHYEQNYIQEKNSQISSAHISELLRRVALVYFPREQVASLKQDAWLEFLNSTSKNRVFAAVSDSLLHVPYQTKQNDIFLSARAWIKERGRPCSN
jgi:hypothetical protein